MTNAKATTHIFKLIFGGGSDGVGAFLNKKRQT